MKDYNGAEITEGCRVRQRNVFDPTWGALLVNVGKEGTVKKVGKTRALVQFDGRCRWNGFNQTDEPVTDRVHADYLEVLPTSAGDSCDHWGEEE